MDCSSTIGVKSQIGTTIKTIKNMQISEAERLGDLVFFFSQSYGREKTKARISPTITAIKTGLIRRKEKMTSTPKITAVIIFFIYSSSMNIGVLGNI